MSPLALVTQADLDAERAALAREAQPARPPHPLEERAAAQEAEASALRRLSAATYELAQARAEAARLGIAQWCTRCDALMPPDRDSDLCPGCVGRANKARWMRDQRAAARDPANHPQEP